MGDSKIGGSGGHSLGGRTSTSWKPGQPGNPARRRPQNWREFRDALRECSEDAAHELTMRVRLSRQATDRVVELARKVASGEAEATELATALDLQTAIGDYVRLTELWLSYAWGKPTTIAPDADVPQDIASREPAEQLFWLEAQVASYRQAIDALRSRHRNIAAVPEGAAEKLAQDDAVEALIAEREARH